MSPHYFIRCLIFPSFSLFFTTFRACENVLEALGGVLTGTHLLSLLSSPATSQAQPLSISNASPPPPYSSLLGLSGQSTQHHPRTTQGGFTTWSSTFDTTSSSRDDESDSSQLQALHTAQTAYLNLFMSVCLLETASGVTVVHADVFSCAESLSRVLSSESWGSGHRVAAGAVMEHIMLTNTSEVSTRPFTDMLVMSSTVCCIHLFLTLSNYRTFFPYLLLHVLIRVHFSILFFLVSQPLPLVAYQTHHSHCVESFYQLLPHCFTLLFPYVFDVLVVFAALCCIALLILFVLPLPYV